MIKIKSITSFLFGPFTQWKRTSRRRNGYDFIFIYINSKKNKKRTTSNFCLCCGGQLSFCGSAWVHNQGFRNLFMWPFTKSEKDCVLLHMIKFFRVIRVKTLSLKSQFFWYEWKSRKWSDYDFVFLLEHGHITDNSFAKKRIDIISFCIQIIFKI